MAKWSPEPWIAGPNELGDYTIWEGEPDEVGEVIAAVMEEANAFRIVAAVNACAGLSTSALEGEVVKQLLWALKGIADEGCILPTTMKSLAQAALDKLKEVPK